MLTQNERIEVESRFMEEDEFEPELNPKDIKFYRILRTSARTLIFEIHFLEKILSFIVSIGY